MAARSVFGLIAYRVQKFSLRMREYTTYQNVILLILSLCIIHHRKGIRSGGHNFNFLVRMRAALSRLYFVDVSIQVRAPDKMLYVVRRVST